MSYAFAIATQLLIDGAWTDITDDTYRRDSITISRGRPDESSTVDPSNCALTLNNRTGKYSPRNPSGAWFGKLGRNTQLRLLTDGTADKYLALAGNIGSCAVAPDATGLHITFDHDIRMEIEPQSWRPGTTYGLARKYVKTDNLRSWSWSVTDGVMQFAWSGDGTAADLHIRTATAAIPSTSGRLALRVVLDADNGAAGHDVKFYTAPSIGGTWTQLGATITVAGGTAVFVGSTPIEIGRIGPDGFDDYAYQGKAYAFELRNGIGGTVVASPNFATADSGGTALTDTQGNIWSLIGNAVMANPNARFHGEVPSWPPRWSKDGKDVWSPITADGITRRLGQGASALKSAMYRGLTKSTDVVAYWPMEDGSGASVLASALSGHPPMAIAGGPARLSTYTGFVASEALPEGSAANFAADVPDYPLAMPTKVQVRFLMFAPAGGITSEGIIARVFTSGTAARWDLKADAANNLRLLAYDGDGVQITDSGLIAWGAGGIIGKRLRISLELTRNSTTSTVDYSIVTLEVGQTGGYVFFGSVAGRSLGKATRVTMNNALFDTVVYGHVSVHNQITSIFDLSSELKAWSGETAPARIMRLCREENIPAVLIGTPTYAVRLGPQLPTVLLDLLTEAAAADLGILYEPREFLGLAYRTRASLYSQTAKLDVTYGDLLSFEPVEDDKGTRNDVTVERPSGASARVERTTGALSTLPPPSGVGRYDEKIAANVELDSALPDQASWRVHLGTVDEARYPVVGLDLAGPSFVASAPLTTAALALDMGDKFAVSNLPTWLPPDAIGQLVQGTTETLIKADREPFEYHWLIDVNCSPASPWDIAVYNASVGAGEARYSSDGSTLAAAATSTATSLSMATPSGPLWSSADQPFDLMIAGERIRVTAVTGSISPQTFTVTRSINGVVKAQLSGATVTLFKPATYAL